MRTRIGNFDLFQETVDKLDGDGALLMASTYLNPMTIGWGTLGIMWGMPLFLIMVRPSRHTWSLMEKSEYFSVSFLNEDYSRELQYCGTTSGRKTNKLEDCKFTSQNGILTPTVYIEESDFHYECRIVHRNSVDSETLNADILRKYYHPGNDFHSIYYGEIIGAFRKQVP